MIKEKIYRLLTTTGSKNYVKSLDLIVRQLNSRYVPKLGMRPIDVKESNTDDIFVRKFQRLAMQKVPEPKFKLNDRVRVMSRRLSFHKAYLPGWSDEILTISRIKPTLNSVSYELSFENGQRLAGTSFSEKELTFA